ncbi:MAG: RAD55 family ATPase [Candidatus Hadarchaeales archaeon]
MARIPTGILSLDSLIGGGFPPGSLILLMGEVGAGNKEFLMTSAIMTYAMKKKLITPAEPDSVFPEEVWWVTMTRSPEDLLNEISMSFEQDLYSLFRDNVKFKDFSEDYFRTSPVPLEWISEKLKEEETTEKMKSLSGVFAGLHRTTAAPSIKPKTALESLADFMTKNAAKNTVIIYTLSDLARLYSDTEARWYDFTLFLRGLQRAAKRWGGIIYLPMTARILDERKEEEISACVDGVLNFQWEMAGPTKRRRVMYFQKFRGLLPRIDGAAVVKFEVSITPTSGFEVARAELIEGIR